MRDKDDRNGYERFRRAKAIQSGLICSRCFGRKYGPRYKQCLKCRLADQRVAKTEELR